MSSDSNKRPDYSMDSFLVHGAMRDEHWDYASHVIPPITASTAFRLASTERGAAGFATFASPEHTGPGKSPIYIYERLAEPTVALLEHQFAELEGTKSATAFASGMAAISGVMLAVCKAGDDIVAHKTIYGCTYSLFTTWLPRFGMPVQFGDFRDVESIRSLIKPTTRVLYFETPANPTLDIIDVQAVAALAKEINASRPKAEALYVVVDNTFATPYCQRPATLGADVVVHSLTKNCMGFGTDMAGLAAHPLELHSAIRMVRKDFGGAVASRAAWNIHVYGISTLAIRMQRQNKSALEVAKYLEAHPQVKKVFYPGLESHAGHEVAKRQMCGFDGEFAPGLMVYFELAGEPAVAYEGAKRFMDHVANNSYCLTLAVSLGNTKTLIEAPALMTHSAYDPESAAKAGMSVAGIRLSIGLENPQDIIRDLESGFGAM